MGGERGPHPRSGPTLSAGINAPPPPPLQVPTFQPSFERMGALNRLANLLGDSRANTVQRKYGRPLKAVVITGSGVLPA